MTTGLPDPIPLEMPTERPDALDDVVRQITGAARRLADVDERLAGAGGAAPGWLGHDAAAAATQVGVVAALVRSASDAMRPVIGRLTDHADRVLITRRQVQALRDEQDEQFRRAWQRWGHVEDRQLQVILGGPELRAIVDELEAGEASRRRQHHVLIEQLADDAAATARVLVDACLAVGARGGAGDPDRVVAYLTAELPGWGDRELARRGRTLAGRLTSGTPEEEAEAASAAAAFAGRAPFANAFLSALGEEGVAYVVRALGLNRYGSDESVARTLAAAFGAAVPGAGTGDPVRRVLDAEYVHPEEAYGLAATAAAGLAMVLAAGTSLPSGGVGTRTVAGWSRQFLLWEREQREPIGRRSLDTAPEVGDPTGLAMSILARRADPGVSATLLDTPGVWEAALHHVWDDGGAALGDVVAQAGREPGALGDRVVHTGLATAGEGLAGNEPSGWTVNRDTLAAIAPALGDAVSGHVAVAVEALQVGVDGRPGGDRLNVLAGLGYVTLDRGAAAAIEQALSGWAQIDPVALVGTTPQAPLPAVAVLSAYMAVQEFAQRASHAMDAWEDRELAEAKKAVWQHSVHLLPEILPRHWGILAGLAEGYASIAVDTDGTWVDRPDRGLVFNRDDAAAVAVAALAPGDASAVRAVTGQATAAFDRTAAVLGERTAPTSPETDWLGPAEDLGIDVQNERMENAKDWTRRLRLHP